MLAPIIVFAYLRLDTFKRVIEALQDNDLAKQSNLYIYCDGVKSEKIK